jgi:hypothetical protein
MLSSNGKFLHICERDRRVSRILKATVTDKVINRAVANSIEQNLSSEADSCSAGKDISNLLWNRKVHFHIHEARS